MGKLKMNNITKARPCVTAFVIFCPLCFCADFLQYTVLALKSLYIQNRLLTQITHDVPPVINSPLANKIVFTEGDGIRQTHFCTDRDFSHIGAVDCTGCIYVRCGFKVQLEYLIRKGCLRAQPQLRHRFASLDSAISSVNPNCTSSKLLTRSPCVRIDVACP